MMRQNDRLDEVLDQLKREYAETVLPPDLEAKLRTASRDLRESKRGWLYAFPAQIWQVGGALAAVLLIGLALWTSRTRPQKPAVVSVAQRPVVETTLPTKEGLEEEQKIPTKRRLTHEPSFRRSPRRRHPETEGGFVPLPGSEGLPMPFEASVIRMQMRKGDLQSYGFDVPPAAAAELIHADFFLGEDGLPRAIRLVR